jgi:hypothetical protein
MHLVTTLCSLIAFSVGFLPAYPAVMVSATLGLLLLSTKRTPLAGLPAVAIVLGSFTVRETGGPQLDAASLPATAAMVVLPWTVLVVLLGGPARRAAEVRGRFFVDRLSVRAAQLGTGATEDVVLLSERLLLDREERWLSGLEGRVRYLQMELLGAALGAVLICVLRWRGSEPLAAAAETALLAGANVLLLLAPRALLVLAAVLGERGASPHPAWFTLHVPWRAWIGLRGCWVLWHARILILPSLALEKMDVPDDAEAPRNGWRRVVSAHLLLALNGPRLVEWIAGLNDVQRSALGSLVPAERTARSWRRVLRYLHDEGLPWWDRSRLVAAICGRVDGLTARDIAVEERVRLCMLASLPAAAARSVVELPTLVEAALSDCDPGAPLPRSLESELVAVLLRLERPAEDSWLVVGARVRPFVQTAMQQLPPHRQIRAVTRLERARSQRAALSHGRDEVSASSFNSGPLGQSDEQESIRRG